MTDDRTDSATLTWTTARGTKHRIVIEPRSDGDYERVEQTWSNGAWRESGREVVTHVDIEVPENSDFLSLFPTAQDDDRPTQVPRGDGDG
jgi:hypothetical protein